MGSSSVAAALALLSLVNVQRVAHHVPPVRDYPAAGHCIEGHQPLACVDHGARAVGVITAWGFLSASEAVRGWLASPRHRAIMLDRRYARAGTYWQGKEYRVVFVEPALETNDTTDPQGTSKSPNGKLVSRV